MLKCSELEDLNKILDRFPGAYKRYKIGEVSFKDSNFEIPAIELGTPGLPTLLLTAGVHGLERIGSEVILAYLKICLERMKWDSVFLETLKKTCLIFVPTVNPVGLARNTRSNGQGVDLMRNAPLDADESGGFFYRGHRAGGHWPFYRGKKGEPLEPEAEALFSLLKNRVWTAKRSLAIDVHSGFGAVDRFWFPFAHSRKPFPHLAEAYWFKQSLDQTYSQHFYAIEPVARQYTMHGDLWDYFYLEYQKNNNGLSEMFLPWTLEMGSWLWVKKNPLQLFSMGGVFDPVRPHRRRRTLRRHVTLFDFMHRSLLSREEWWNLTVAERSDLEFRGMECWYE